MPGSGRWAQRGERWANRGRETLVSSGRRAQSPRGPSRQLSARRSEHLAKGLGPLRACHWDGHSGGGYPPPPANKVGDLPPSLSIVTSQVGLLMAPATQSHGDRGTGREPSTRPGPEPLRVHEAHSLNPMSQVRATPGKKCLFVFSFLLCWVFVAARELPVFVGIVGAFLVAKHRL